jgi:hypothetical protein
MGQTPPGLIENSERCGSRRWLLVLGLALALTAYAVFSTVQQRQRMASMVDQLGDTSAGARAQAIDYLFDGDPTDGGRLSESVRGLRRLESVSAFFSDPALAQLFEEVIEPRDDDWSTLAFRAPLTFLRSIRAAVRLDPLNTDLRREAIAKLDMMLQSGNREGGYGLVWDVTDQTERDLIIETFQEIAEAASKDTGANSDTAGLFTALSLIGDAAYPLIEPLLDAKSGEVRRDAWLALGVLDVGGGYTARWRDAPTPVAEAMIASSVVLSTDPDAAIERFRGQIDEGSSLADALDALEQLPRDAQGWIDLSDAPPQLTPLPKLVSDLYWMDRQVEFANSRLMSFRDRFPADSD